jgi:excisionase family DNA binding protein
MPATPTRRAAPAPFPAHFLDSERLTLRDAAELLRVSIPSVWRWLTHGFRGHVLPSYLVGGKRVVLRTDLQEWLALCQRGGHHER